MEIENMIIVSTAHITSEECDDELQSFDSFGEARIFRHGFILALIHDPEDGPEDQSEWSQGLRDIVKIARANDCRWLSFDADGPYIDGACSYDW